MPSFYISLPQYYDCQVRDKGVCGLWHSKKQEIYLSIRFSFPPSPMGMTWRGPGRRCTCRRSVSQTRNPKFRKTVSLIRLQTNLSIICFEKKIIFFILDRRNIKNFFKTLPFNTNHFQNIPEKTAQKTGCQCLCIWHTKMQETHGKLSSNRIFPLKVRKLPRLKYKLNLYDLSIICRSNDKLMSYILNDCLNKVLPYFSASDMWKI